MTAITLKDLVYAITAEGGNEDTRIQTSDGLPILSVSVNTDNEAFLSESDQYEEL